MKIVYIAEDGTQFNNKYECLDYEWDLNHCDMKKFIIMYDINGELLDDYLAEETYNNAEKIIIKDKEGVEYLQDLADYTGFLGYADITTPGVWQYDKNNNQTFIKERKLED